MNDTDCDEAINEWCSLAARVFDSCLPEVYFTAFPTFLQVLPNM